MSILSHLVCDGSCTNRIFHNVSFRSLKVKHYTLFGNFGSYPFFVPEDSSLTRTKVEHRDEHDSPPHQENPRPSTPDESFSLSAEVPGPSQTRAHIGKNNWNYCLVQVGDVCLPERLSSQITQLNDHSQVSSLVTINDIAIIVLLFIKPLYIQTETYRNRLGCQVH